MVNSQWSNGAEETSHALYPGLSDTGWADYCYCYYYYYCYYCYYYCCYYYYYYYYDHYDYYDYD